MMHQVAAAFTVSHFQLCTLFVSAVDMYLTEGDKMKISSIHLEPEVFTLLNGTAGVHTEDQ